ncbi:MAG: hypothetical protein J7604_07630 [Sporocytophaga sp.]|uniref:tetratricopeptide repeat protein n=1 Tax=Sporocytophaga sp. TaxID=2231183 RepID=UPI001B13BDB2|nr:hypothetical protein [Sporocytophaga sp.]MBO9700066.1 hypothetical protein [Sporocytophaga sp.]
MADPTKIFPKEDKCLSLDVMMDYIHDRLSNKERNHVERHTLQCELCNEAMDGLALSIEDNARNIIASIDEVNHLESQILLSASVQEPEYSLDETADFNKKESILEEESASLEMAAMPAAAAPMRRKEKASVVEAPTFHLKDAAPSKNKFDWSRMAAAIAGLLLLGGGIFFILQQKWTKDHPVADVKKSEVNSIDKHIDNANTDSIIAIAPLQKEQSPQAPVYSDGVLNSEVPINEEALVPSKAEEIHQEGNAVVSEIQEGEVITEKPNASSAPAKQEADKLSEALMDNKAQDKSINSEFKKEIAIESESIKAKPIKSKKSIAAPTADAVQDSVFIADGNSMQTSFDKGLSLYNKGEYKKASAQFLNVKQSDPNYEDARWYLAKSYTAIGQKEKAKKVYLELVEMKGKYKEKAEEELRK